jgi:hypothetical protein
MAARVSKEDRELFRQFLAKLEDGSFLGVSENDAVKIVLAADTFAQAKLAVQKSDLDKREAAAKKKAEEEKAKTAAPLPAAPKKKAAKGEKPEEGATEEKKEGLLVENRRYEAVDSPKLKNAILIFRTPHGEEKGKFEVAFQGDGDIPTGKVVILPADKVVATKRRVPKAA